MLAATTEVSRLTSRRQLGDAMSAARALFLCLAVDGHEAPVLFVRLVARLRLDRLDGRAEHLAGCRVEAGKLIRFQRRALAEWQEFGLLENLVRVGVAHAGDEGLVSQQVLEFAGMPPDALGKFGKWDSRRIRAELRPSRDRRQRARRHPAHAAHLD